MRRTRELSFALVLCAVALAGCAATAPAAVAEPETRPTAGSPTAQALPPVAMNTPAPSDGLAPTPTLRTGQEATDPATVNLASGKPTLVKFFAFW